MFNMDIFGSKGRLKIGLLVGLILSGVAGCKGDDETVVLQKSTKAHVEEHMGGADIPVSEDVYVIDEDDIERHYADCAPENMNMISISHGGIEVKKVGFGVRYDKLVNYNHENYYSFVHCTRKNSDDGFFTNIMQGFGPLPTRLFNWQYWQQENIAFITPLTGWQEIPDDIQFGNAKWAICSVETGAVRFPFLEGYYMRFSPLPIMTTKSGQYVQEIDEKCMKAHEKYIELVGEQ